MTEHVLNDIAFRPFQSQDVDEVNRLFREAYGESYPYKVDSRVPAGAYYYVAVPAADTGSVIGFARSRWLEAEDCQEAYPCVHELGGYVVAQAFRRRGIGERLSQLCEQAAAADRGEIEISNSEPVSWGNGLASQRIFSKHGFRVLGISVLKYPDISPEWHGKQPASMTIVARRAEGQGDFNQYDRFLPPDYERFVRSLMYGCGYSVQGHPAHPMPRLIHHAPVRARGMAGAEIVDIPANWPEALPAIDRLRQEGYLFSAFLPEHGRIASSQGHLRFDYLRLYRPPGLWRKVCDWSLVQVLPCAESIKGFLVREFSSTSADAMPMVLHPDAHLILEGRPIS